ncbi:hypothetical protein [Paraburkholderia sp. GAS42]|uniref:hypothetical protein n=1 Tax=Paraburkholderia sp. GAS42 TaxID=3035135 RepID=UPI003D1B4771
MQAQKRFAQLVLPFAFALPGLIVQAAAAESQSPPAQVQTGATVASPVALAGSPAVAVDAAIPLAPSTAITAGQPSGDVSFGVAMSNDQLAERRGGDVQVGKNTLNGSVSDNTAYKVSTGSNAITQGSFAGANGLSSVIQNTGANVLIQNATVLNVRFGE